MNNNTNKVQYYNIPYTRIKVSEISRKNHKVAITGIVTKIDTNNKQIVIDDGLQIIGFYDDSINMLPEVGDIIRAFGIINFLDDNTYNFDLIIIQRLQNYNLKLYKKILQMKKLCK